MAEDERGVAEALEREARERILLDGPVAELANVALTAVVMVLSFVYVPWPRLAAFALVVSALSIARMAFRYRLRDRVYDRASRRRFRAIVITQALAWGVAYAVFAAHLRFRDQALFLVVLLGLVAAATTTLAADKLAYRLYLAATMLPAALGALLGLRDTTRIAALLLIALFGAAMLFLHDRAHTALLRQVTTNVRLAASEAAAGKVADMRTAFLATMSHEIRTPLNALLGLTELLLDSDMSAEQRRSLSVIQTAGESLLTLLNDILDLSKIEADALQLEATSFDLHRLVESTAALLAVRARERRIELLTDIQSGVPAQARGDPTRLRQVLTNLVGNAIKFTSKGEVVISLTRADAGRDGPDALVRFAVRDTGIGIPADRLEAIFQPFSQADASTTRMYGGTGLGLTISQRLVALMGGRLAVASEVGKGSEFSFTVKLGVEAAVPAPLPAPGAVKLAGLRMVVVDDNQTNRRIVREMLGTAGVTVDEAAGADEGLAALQRSAAAGTPYALAILDARMPGKDGFALARMVGAEPALAGTGLMMLTSTGERGDAQRCRELGIRGYLTKPVTRADLIELVGSVLTSAAAGPGAGVPDLVTRHSIKESRKPLRILLVEDNPVNQDIAATMLRKRGHRVDVAGDGRAAVELVTRQPYDVVLMDLEMPVMGGLEATRAIRALPDRAAMPIVALSAHPAGEERGTCLAAGMNGYVTKPFKPFELHAAVEGWSAQATEPPPVELEKFRRDMAAAGIESAVDDLIRSFVTGAPDRREEIAAAVAGARLPDLARFAHSLKSSAAQIGAHRLAASLQDMEAAAKAGSLDQVKAEFGQFKEEIGKVIEYLDHALSR